jgi:murein DD-endopeptidase MepM/ murein hydrolase activator NlpD
MEYMAVDHEKTLKRSDEAFALSLSRGEEAFNISTARTVEQYILQMDRMSASFTRSMTDNNEAWQISVKQAHEDQKRALATMEHEHNVVLTNMKADLIRAYTEVNGSIDELSQKALAAVKTAGVQNVSAITTAIDTLVGAFKAAKATLGEGVTLTVSTITTFGKPDSAQTGVGGYQETGFAGGPTGKGAEGWSGKWKTYDDGSFHGGADFGVKSGSVVYATRDAKVSEVDNLGNKSYGKYIKLSDGKDDFYFGHLSSQLVKKGASVYRGQMIGLSGDTGNSTGPHLHFEVRPKGAKHDDAIDPSKFFALGGIVTGPTRAVIGEGGHSEAVIPLNNQGSVFMAQTIKQALASVFSTPVTTSHNCADHQSMQVDKSTNFTGEVHVVAADPNEMARKMEQTARMRNLVRPGSSR